MKDRLRQGADEVADVLRRAGHEAYLAGGCVRDLVLGRTPKDYDIATDARPEQIVRLFRRTIEVGAAFGVVKVVLGKGLDYEVATFRTEGTYSDGRRPDDVVYSDDWREDVARRDLTINALLMDPVTGEILDAVGGRADIDDQVIRAVGDPERRFEEDKLRMLRAVRFAARFGFEIEPATYLAIRRRAETLGVVSKERIVTELEGIYKTNAGRGFCLLDDLGLLRVALPHVPDHRVPRLRGGSWSGPVESASAADRNGTPRRRLVRRMTRFDEQVEGLEPSDRFAIGWAVTIDGLSAKDAEVALRELKLSREAVRKAMRLQETMTVLADCWEPGRAAVMRLAADDDAEVVARFQRVMLGPDAPEVACFAEARQDLRARPLPPRPILTGADLKQLGLPPSKEFKALLTAVDDAVLERRVVDKAQALALVEELRGPRRD